jgi:ABC-2 type transport system ATP-binding protein
MTDLMTDATITFYGVAKSFGPTMALSDVSFAAPAGRITAFVGRNGADKSTALRILLGTRRRTPALPSSAVKPPNSFRSQRSALWSVPEPTPALPCWII